MFNLTILSLVQGFTSLSNSFSLSASPSYKLNANLQFCHFQNKYSTIFYNIRNLNVASSSFSNFLSLAVQVDDLNSECPISTVTSPTEHKFENCLLQNFSSSIINIQNTNGNVELRNSFILNCYTYDNSLIKVHSPDENQPTLILNRCCFTNSTSFITNPSNDKEEGIICTVKTQLTLEQCSFFGIFERQESLSIHPTIKHSYHSFKTIGCNLTHNRQSTQIQEKTLFDISANRENGKDVEIRWCAFGYNTGSVFISVIEYSKFLLEGSVFLNNTGCGSHNSLVYIGDPKDQSSINFELKNSAYANNYNTEIFTASKKVTQLRVEFNILDVALPTKPSSPGTSWVYYNNTVNLTFNHSKLLYWVFEYHGGIYVPTTYQNMQTGDIECVVPAYESWYPSASELPAPTQSQSPSQSPSPSASESPLPSPSQSPSQSPSPSASQSPTASQSPSPTASQSPTASPSQSPTASPSQSPSPSQTPTGSIISSPTSYASPSLSLSPTEEEISITDKDVPIDPDSERNKTIAIACGVTAAAAAVAASICCCCCCAAKKKKEEDGWLVNDASHEYLLNTTNNGSSAITYTNELQYDVDDPFAEDFLPNSNDAFQQTV